MRLRYLPLLMIYYAYGALGLVTIAEAFWIKEALTFTPAELAAIAVWLTLPWTIKMVFGQLAELGADLRLAAPRLCLSSARASSPPGSIILAGAAGGWIAFASKNALYVAAQLLIVIGVVLQDVVADAMTTEVVDRKRPDGTPRPLHEVERELGLVQVLGRLALWSGILSVAGLSGWLAQIFSYETVFLLGLIVPAISRHRRHARASRRRKPAADRLAHPRRRTAVRRRRARHRPWRPALRPGAHLSHLGDHHRADARPRRPGRRRAASQEDPLRRARDLLLSRHARAWGRAIAGSPSTCSASTKASTARWRRSARA